MIEIGTGLLQPRLSLAEPAERPFAHQQIRNQKYGAEVAWRPRAYVESQRDSVLQPNSGVEFATIFMLLFFFLLVLRLPPLWPPRP
jgi:hypothetical protein